MFFGSRMGAVIDRFRLLFADHDLYLDTPGITENQGQRECIASHQGLVQAEQHEVIATGLEGDVITRGEGNLIRSLHLHQAIDMHMLVHLNLVSHRRMGRNQTIRGIPLILDTQIGGAGRRNGGQGARPWMINVQLAELIFVGLRRARY